MKKFLVFLKFYLTVGFYMDKLDFIVKVFSYLNREVQKGKPVHAVAKWQERNRDGTSCWPPESTQI